MTIPGFEDLYPDAEFGYHKFKCTTCNEILDGGIINLSSHWAKCGGKDFQEALVKRRLEKGTLTNDDVEEFKNLLK